jgi:hypothetical protein
VKGCYEWWTTLKKQAVVHAFPVGLQIINAPPDGWDGHNRISQKVLILQYSLYSSGKWEKNARTLGAMTFKVKWLGVVNQVCMIHSFTSESCAQHGLPSAPISART